MALIWQTAWRRDKQIYVATINRTASNDDPNRKMTSVTIANYSKPNSVADGVYYVHEYTSDPMLFQRGANCALHKVLTKLHEERAIDILPHGKLHFTLVYVDSIHAVNRVRRFAD